MRYGFIYETTNLYNGMKYIGQHKRSQNSEDPDDSWYLGSGTLLNISINHAEKTLGESWRDNYSRIILCECDSEDELNEMEEYYLNKVDAANNKAYYNITNKSNQGFPVTKGMKLPDYWRANLSKAQKNRKDSSTRGKILIYRGEEIRYVLPSRLDKFLSEGWIKGVHPRVLQKRSEKMIGENNPASKIEVREKISESTKEAMWRPEVREKFLQAIKDNKTPRALENMRQAKLGDKNPCYNKIWINNGECNRRVLREEFINTYQSQGFVEGRLSKPYGPRKMES